MHITKQQPPKTEQQSKKMSVAEIFSAIEIIHIAEQPDNAHGDYDKNLSPENIVAEFNRRKKERGEL